MPHMQAGATPLSLLVDEVKKELASDTAGAGTDREFVLQDTCLLLIEAGAALQKRHGAA